MSDRPRSHPAAPGAAVAPPRVRPARLVSHPQRCPTTEAAERDLRAALRQQLFDGFEKGEGFPVAWDVAWAEAADYRGHLLTRAPALRTDEADYRELLVLDWERWCTR